MNYSIVRKNVQDPISLFSIIMTYEILLYIRQEMLKTTLHLVQEYFLVKKGMLNLPQYMLLLTVKRDMICLPEHPVGQGMLGMSDRKMLKLQQHLA